MVQSSAKLRAQFEAERRGKSSKESMEKKEDENVKQKKSATERKLSKYGLSTVTPQQSTKKRKKRKNMGLYLRIRVIIDFLI